ncbi:MAG: L-dopachrome tautomerase-related protein [Verrucomicrobiota bacterium]
MKCIQVLIYSLFVSASVLLAGPSLKVICKLDQRPGNPAVTPDGTVYISMHPFDQPEFKIMILKSGKAVPYPNEEVSKNHAAVIGIQATQDGALWWMDMGNQDISPKLVGWDTRNNRLKAIHVIPKEVRVANSFLQDFAIDEKRQRVFVADMSRGNLIDKSEPAIIVLDLSTGQTRRVLSGHPFYQPDESPIIAEGKAMQTKDANGFVYPIKLGLNPIAIDPENEWVYFSTMTAGKLYRVPSEILGDYAKSDEEIESKIETYGDKPSSDGIAAGENGVVYVTNVDENAISMMDDSGTKTWIKDDKQLIWPDAAYIAPDKSVVVTVNQLNRAPAFNDGKSLAEKPYTVVRIKE